MKKVKNLILTTVLVCSIMSMTNVMADTLRETMVLGNNQYGMSYDYTTPEVKQNDSQEILLICEGVHYSSSNSLKTCKVLPQNSSTKYGTYSADSKSLTYNFGAGFDKRLTNGVAAGRYVRLRFAMNATKYQTTYDILRYYY